MPPGNKKVEIAASVPRGDAIRRRLNNSRTLGYVGLLLIPLIGLGHYAQRTEISFAVFYLAANSIGAILIALRDFQAIRSLGRDELGFAVPVSQSYGRS